LLILKYSRTTSTLIKSYIASTTAGIVSSAVVGVACTAPSYSFPSVRAAVKVVVVDMVLVVVSTLMEATSGGDSLCCL